MKDKILFFSTFLAKPKEVGSVIPSSKFLVNEMLKNIDFKSIKFIAEYGSGLGVITKALLKHARNDAVILCFETNKKFYEYLKMNIVDERLIIINEGAENIRTQMKKYNIPQIDAVLAVLSFSTLGVQVKSLIIEETRKILSENGKFIFCRYFPHFENGLQKYFSKNYLKFVPLNIPPCFVYTCEK